ncbi:MAG: hypothetical protein ACE5Q6_21565 [Dehalococcoidia bacterium]
MTLAVTEQAAAVLQGLLEQQNPEADQVLRLIYNTEGNVQLALGTEREDDQVVDYLGKTVMVIEPLISDHLSGSTLDLQETSSGMSLTLYRSSDGVGPEPG